MSQKNILILGGFGFIGRNIIEELTTDDQYTIIVFDKNGNPFSGSHLGQCVVSYKGDFSRTDDLERIFKEWKIDIVIHAIATTVPVTSQANIAKDIGLNLLSTIQLLELMRFYKVPQIIFLSSGGAVYGPVSDGSVRAFREDDQTNPISSYGIIKLAIEKYIILYHRLYGIHFLILRLSNPYGKYHQSEVQGIINVSLRKVLKGIPVVIWGDGAAIKDYMYVSDCAAVIHSLLDKGVVEEVFNVGSGTGYSINDILKIMYGEIGAFDVEYKEAKLSDISYAVLDITKLMSFVPMMMTNIRDGIRKTHGWLKNTLYEC